MLHENEMMINDYQFTSTEVTRKENNFLLQ